MSKNNDPRMKSVYIVKSANPELDDLEKKKKTETKAVYILKECEEAIVRYQDCIFNFVDEKAGLFYLVSDDKMFYQTVRTALRGELGLQTELICLATSVQRAVGELESLIKHGKRPLVFVEHELRKETTLRFVKWMKDTYRDIPVIVLSLEVSAGVLAQFHESGANNFITKPASTNVLVEKIAFTIEPQTELQALIRQGKEYLEYNDFENALDTAYVVLEKKPNSAVGFMILGDALKGLARRAEALRAYKSAEENANMYLEPLKRIVEFYVEDNDEQGQLEYLRKLDRISPYSLERKLDLGKLLIKHGRPEDAERHIQAALDLAVCEGQAKVSAVGHEFAEQLLNVDPVLSEKFFRHSIQAARTSVEAPRPLVFNRLGLALRKQGKWQEAVKEYEQAEKLSPNDENLQFNMAMALAEGKDWSGAAARLDKARGINPEFNQGNATVSYHMGIIYSQAQAPAQARPFLEHVQEISPGFKEVERLLAQLPE